MWVWGRAAAAIASGEAARAADILEQAGAKTLEAEARLLAARELTAQGRRAEAAVQLAPALAFYREVRASAYVREAEVLLPAAG